MTKNKRNMTTKTLVFSAMAIALAVVISTVIKLPSLPNGGSVTLFSMLVITLIGYWYGPGVGLTAAVTYGVLQFLVEPYVVHPVQVIIDFPLAFGALGLSGFFQNKKNGLLWGYLTGVAGRFFFAMVSGLIFYTEYVGSLKGNALAVWWSTAYNLSYLLPEAVMTVLLLFVPAVRKALESLKRLATE